MFSTGGVLNLNAPTVTLNNLDATFDNTNSSNFFLFTTKDNFDIGLSSGLNTDHLYRFTNTGDTIFNFGFGTGTDDNITLLDSELTSVDLKYFKLSTARISLTRGTSNTGNATIYSSATAASARVSVTAHNLATGDKEIVEYFVTNNGTDVSFTDFNNVKTGAELFSSVFDVDGSNNVRITVTLNTGITTGNAVDITVVNNITKR